MRSNGLVRALVLATCLALLGATAASGAPKPKPTTTTTKPAPKPASTPFDGLNAFCNPSTVPAGARNTSTPGVTPSTIVVADDSLDSAALSGLGIDQMNFHQAFQAFFDEINRCGGINGRKIVLRSALFNPTAPDIPGQLKANCRQITEEFKAFITVGVTTIENAHCIAVQHKTIMNAPGYQSSGLFQGSKGRLVSIYPASDRLAAAFLADATSQSLFAHHTVTVLGLSLNPGRPAEIQTEYIAPLKAKKVPVNLEVSACVGAGCASAMKAVVTRMKANGTDVIVIDHDTPAVGSLGALAREMKDQGLKALVTGVDSDGLFSDSQMGSLQRVAGTDGAAWLERYGMLGMGMDPNLQRGGWRTGQVKEAPFAKMCTATLARLLKQRQYRYDEADIESGRWSGTVNVCQQVRQVARAIYRLGNTVTTERMVESLRALSGADVRRDDAPTGRDRWLFVWPDVTPTVVTTNKFAYPCTLPSRQSIGCMVPNDRPIRVRKVKV